MGLGEFVSRTSVANVVAGVIVIAGFIYFIWTKNTDGVMLITGAALGWLFKERRKVEV